MRFLKVSLLGFLVVLIPSISFAADSNTVVTDKTPPTASAPSIVINNSDVCKSTASAAIQTQILGFASGITVTDKNCERLKLARSLYSIFAKMLESLMACGWLVHHVPMRDRLGMMLNNLGWITLTMFQKAVTSKKK